jgi:hypothetical protein
MFKRARQDKKDGDDSTTAELQRSKVSKTGDSEPTQSQTPLDIHQDKIRAAVRTPIDTFSTSNEASSFSNFMWHMFRMNYKQLTEKVGSEYTKHVCIELSTRYKAMYSANPPRKNETSAIDYPAKFFPTMMSVLANYHSPGRCLCGVVEPAPTRTVTQPPDNEANPQPAAGEVVSSATSINFPDLRSNLNMEVKSTTKKQRLKMVDLHVRKSEDFLSALPIHGNQEQEMSEADIIKAYDEAEERNRIEAFEEDETTSSKPISVSFDCIGGWYYSDTQICKDLLWRAIEKAHIVFVDGEIDFPCSLAYAVALGKPVIFTPDGLDALGNSAEHVAKLAWISGNRIEPYLSNYETAPAKIAREHQTCAAVLHHVMTQLGCSTWDEYSCKVFVD